MQGVLSREQAREYDRFATQQCGVPSLLLMENAGRGATERLLCQGDRRLGRVMIVAGPGNNGGDGFVLARRLLVLGHSVVLWLVGEPSRLAGDAKIMWDAYVGLGGDHHVAADDAQLSMLKGEIAAADTIVDALFGTGLARPVEGLHAEVIASVNSSPAFVLALDIPSGLDANTGRVLGIAVQAEATITFGGAKLGHFSSEGADCVGRLEIIDIGIPQDLWLRTGHSAERLDAEDFVASWRPRRASSHKGRAGRVAVVAGHPGTIGAALLAARGALRMGAGLVTHVGLPETIDAIESRVLETMTKRLDPGALESSLDSSLQGMDTIVLGPGLGSGGLQREMVLQIAERARATVVVDADALTILADDPEILQRAAAPRILLPHRGELARLLRSTVADVEQDPYAALSRAVTATQAVVLLKGAYSFVGAPNQKIAIVAKPCSAIGTAGSGDVLSGVVAALAVEHPPLLATALAAHLHGRAGQMWTEVQGSDRGMVANDLAEHLPAAVAELARRCHGLTV